MEANGDPGLTLGQTGLWCKSHPRISLYDKCLHQKEYCNIVAKYNSGTMVNQGNGEGMVP